MKPQPFFSVIVPSYNRKPFLEKCLRSVLGQDITEFELIIVDDGSTDGTDKMVSFYSEDARIKYIRQKNHGVAHARNRGLEKAEGDLIAFLDSDDWWEKNKLSRTLDYIGRYPHIKIFHSDEIWYRKGKLLPQKYKHKKPSGNVYMNALPLCCISISTAVIHRDVFKTIGAFDESFEACEDYEFWLRATSRYEVKLIPEALTLKDGGRPDQLSSKVWGLDRFRIKALKKILDTKTLPAEYREATLEELRKKCLIFAAGAEKRGKTKEAEYYKDLCRYLYPQKGQDPRV